MKKLQYPKSALQEHERDKKAYDKAKTLLEDQLENQYHRFSEDQISVIVIGIQRLRTLKKNLKAGYISVERESTEDSKPARQK